MKQPSPLHSPPSPHLTIAFKIRGFMMTFPYNMAVGEGFTVIIPEVSVLQLWGSSCWGFLVIHTHRCKELMGATARVTIQSIAKDYDPVSSSDFLRPLWCHVRQVTPENRPPRVAQASVSGPGSCCSSEDMSPWARMIPPLLPPLLSPVFLFSLFSHNSNKQGSV